MSFHHPELPTYVEGRFLRYQTQIKTRNANGHQVAVPVNKPRIDLCSKHEVHNTH